MSTNPTKRRATNPTKRRASSKNQQDNELAIKPLLSSGKYRKVKASVGSRSMDFFLDSISSYEKENNSNMSSIVETIRTSPILVHAMLLCQERFVRVLATELSITKTTVNSATKDSDIKVHRVGESHVQIAMQELGMHDIFLEAKKIQRNVVRVEDEGGLPNKRKRKNERRVKQWSEEELTEQERLLASSKEKLLRGSD
jgi:hypothetical protein